MVKEDTKIRKLIKPKFEEMKNFHSMRKTNNRVKSINQAEPQEAEPQYELESGQDNKSLVPLNGDQSGYYGIRTRFFEKIGAIPRRIGGFETEERKTMKKLFLGKR